MSNRKIEDGIVFRDYDLKELDQAICKREWKLIREMKPYKSSIKKPFIVGVVHHASGYQSLTPVSSVKQRTIKMNLKRKLFPVHSSTKKNIISGNIGEISNAPSDIGGKYENENYPNSPVFDEVNISPQVVMRGLLKGISTDKKNVLKELQNTSDVGGDFITKINVPNCDITPEMPTKNSNLQLRMSSRKRKPSQKMCCPTCQE